MDKKKSAAGNSSGANKTNQASDPSKTASTHERNNIRMVKNTLLIWLDNNIDENSADYRNTITEFRRVVDTVNTFTDGDQCLQFIESMNNERAYMVISGSLGQHIVPRVHDMSQVDSIFIFCGNKKYHEQWAKEWPKIKGVFTEIAPIREAIKQAAQQCEQDSIPISFTTTNSDISKWNSNKLDPSYMYTQILKEILLSTEFEEKDIKEFTDYCREMYSENVQELNNIKKFEREYHNETPIWWYTYECFLYPMINRALRLMDVAPIIRMGFFISDLHRQIEQLYSDQFNKHHSGKTFIVYRGQGMSKADFEHMKIGKGGLMSYNNFLSTSKNRDISLEFARRALSNPDIVGVLLVMKIDPSESTIPFASIHDVSYYSTDDEILFSMQTVFRINDITPIDGSNRLFQVNLALTRDTDKELDMLTSRIREEVSQHAKGWCQMGYFLTKMGIFDKAEQVYEIILKRIPDEREKGNIYHQFGSTKADKGEYEEAIIFYEKAVAIWEKTLLSNHPLLASSYTNIGLVYDKMGEYSKALLSHEKALRIYQKIRPPNHPDLASSYNNIGLVYNNMKEYSKALSSYEKALEIRERTLPPNHPDLASSFNSIGLVYKNMGEYSKALSFHERAVNIGQNALTSDHPDLQMYKKNLESVKKK